MSEHTQEQIDDLISCRKEITEPPKKNSVLLHGSYRNDFKCASGGRLFSVFMRQNFALPENFSVGLMYSADDGHKLMLMRCNGPHGPHSETFSGPPWHEGFHIHLASKDMIDAGRKPEAHAELTREFAGYESALRYFLKRANIKWSVKEFPNLTDQTTFLPDE